MKAIKYEAQEGFVWVRKDKPDWYLGGTLYLSPKDNIEDYEQLIPVAEEEDDGQE